LLTFDQIKELVELVSQRGLSGLEIERSGFRLRIDGQAAPNAAHPAAGAGAAAPAALAAPAPAAGAPPALPAALAAAPAAAPAPAAHVLNSPIVGTFYRAPAPGADPFVQVGSRVERGQVLCIIEAMKLMNEIESDADGVIEQIFPQNAQAVEFGEPLFAIRTS
jgi:acetyl-CoA carboxylase biotin carboxyl carrier protein